MVGDRLNYVGTIMELSNNTWSSFQEDGIKEQTGQSYKDINCVVQDPTDPEHYLQLLLEKDYMNSTTKTLLINIVYIIVHWKQQMDMIHLYELMD